MVLVVVVLVAFEGMVDDVLCKFSNACGSGAGCGAGYSGSVCFLEQVILSVLRTENKAVVYISVYLNTENKAVVYIYLYILIRRTRL